MFAGQAQDKRIVDETVPRRFLLLEMWERET